MNQFLSIFLIGVALSMDAFAVSVCKGLASKTIDWNRAFVVALSFGVFQAVMPLIGWLLGESVQWLIEPVDHWIACALLAGIGAKMIWDAFHDEDDDDAGAESADAKSFLVELLLLSIATSIDAFVVGISFSMAQIPIVEAMVIIGITTFVLCLVGYGVGNRFGARFEKPATIAGGIVLILLGIKIVLEHLGMLG